MISLAQTNLRKRTVLLSALLLAIIIGALISFGLFPVPESAWVLIIYLALGPFIYFIPSCVAASRNHRNFAAICCLNAFLGWTFIGWVAALVWALVEQERVK